MREWIFSHDFLWGSGMSTKKSFSINSNILKLLACLFMLCDHIGLILMNNNAAMRAIGRLSFPIFVFLLVEGYKHTSDIKKYFLRLLAFAFISEVPYDLALYGKVFCMDRQNIYFTLAAGLLILWCGELAKSKLKTAFVIMGIIFILTLYLNFDYGLGGLLLIVICYKYTPVFTQEYSLKDKIRLSGKYMVLSALVYGLYYGLTQLYAVLSVVPISMYSGERGRKGFKYLFYLFYPVHLLVLYWVKNYFM